MDFPMVWIYVAVMEQEIKYGTCDGCIDDVIKLGTQLKLVDG